MLGHTCDFDSKNEEKKKDIFAKKSATNWKKENDGDPQAVAKLLKNMVANVETRNDKMLSNSDQYIEDAKLWWADIGGS